MFDFGWSEIGLVVVIAVIILGPKELPRAMRTAGQWMRKLRMLAGDFQQHLDSMVDEAELSDLRDQAKRLNSSSVKQELSRSIDPDGTVTKSLAETQQAADASQQDIQKAANTSTSAQSEAKASAQSLASPKPDGDGDPAAGSRV